MDHKIREEIPDDGHNADVLHDDGVRPQIRQHGERFRRGKEFGLPDKSIEGHMDAFPVPVRIFDEFRHFAHGEIFGTLPGIELFQPAVHGVRTRVERGKRACHISRRSKQLNFRKLIFSHWIFRIIPRQAAFFFCNIHAFFRKIQGFGDEKTQNG